MGKLSQMVLNEKMRRVASREPAGDIAYTKLGRNLRNAIKPKKVKTEEEKALAKQRRLDNKNEKQKKQEELDRLRKEDIARKKTESDDAAAKLKQDALDRQAEIDKVKAETEASAKEAEEYRKITTSNQKRDDKYADSMSKVDHVSGIKVEKEEPRSSGLIDTAVKSLRF